MPRGKRVKIINGRKRCTGPCKKTFPATSQYFYKNGSGSLESYCQACDKYLAKQWRIENPDKYRKSKGSLSMRFYRLKHHANTRKTEFSLTKEQYIALVDGARCSYCRGGLPGTGGGLDRIDNKHGYSIKNVVPCCHKCNDDRGKLTHGEWMAVIRYRRRSGMERLSA